MIVRGITRPLGRLSPAVGQVSHVLRTRLPLNWKLPSSPVRLTCVRHAASVRPEPGSNSPMIGKFEQLTERLVHLSSESQIRMKPLAAHVLKARVRSNGAALHTLDHQFSKSGPRKRSRRDADSSRGTEVSQGGHLLEDTRPSTSSGSSW